MTNSNDWKQCRLGDHLRIKHGYAFKGDYFADNGSFVVLTPGNFRDEGGFKSKEQEKYYTGAIPDGYILNRGDLLVAMTEQAQGLLGSSAIVPADHRYLHNQRLGLVIDLDEHAVDKHFLYYLFNTDSARTQIQATATGAKVRHTSPSRIENVWVRLPSVATQRRIAGILAAYDDLIENNTRRITILEEMAQATYREWFVNFRFPGHKQVGMVGSVAGAIPRGWTIQKIGDVANVNARSIKSDEAPSEIRYVDIAGVSPGRINEIRTLRWENAPSRARRVLQHGDIIWSTVRPNLRSFSLVLKPEPGTIASTGFAVVSPTRVPFSYLYLYTSTQQFTDYLVNHTRGSAYPAVNVADFENAPILVPDDRPLEAFHQIMVPVLDQRKVLADSIAVLRRTRDLLLPKLISGEIDVSAIEDVLAGAA